MQNFARSRKVVKREHQRSIAELRCAAQAGDARAQYWLGRRYNDGKFLARDDEEAQRWYAAAAAQGDPEAVAAEAACHMTASMDAAAVRQTVGLLTRAAELNQPKAYWNLAVMAKLGCDTQQEKDARAHPYYLAAARLGDGRAMEKVARHLATRDDATPASRTEALKWIRRAARMGEVISCYHLAMLGGESPRRRRQWLIKAARKRFPPALFKLGFHYLARDDRPGDREHGLALCRKAAEHGLPEAMELLTRLALDGQEGEAPAVEQALAWARMALRKGRIEALLKVVGAHHGRHPAVPGGRPAILEILDEIPGALMVNHPHAINLKAMSLADLGVSLDEAEVLSADLLEHEPLNDNFLDTRAWVLVCLGRLEEADEMLDTVVRLSPRHGDHLLHRAVLRWRQGRTAEAEADLAMACAADQIDYHPHEITSILARFGWRPQEPPANPACDAPRPPGNAEPQLGTARERNCVGGKTRG